MNEVAIAAPHTEAVRAAELAVAAGGNAVDAALAAAAALTVVYPHQCSLGGDLVALVHRPDATVRSVLSIGAAAATADADAVRARYSRMPGQGAESVTVPGVVAGWQALASYGRLTLAPPLRHAAALARGGVAVSPGLAHAITSRRDAVLADPGLRELLTTDGTPRTRMHQPRLAATLDALADDPSAFYRGYLAQQLTDFLRHGGSTLSTSDFSAHRAETADPLVLDLPAGRWYAAPPPSQGVVLLAVLAGMAETELVELCRRAAATRDRLLGDPHAGPVDVEALLRAEIPAPTTSAVRTAGDTVAVTAVGRDGLAVSLIQSVYQSFGSGLLEPETGIVLHNRASAFSLEPGHPAEFGPGRRPPHTLCPVLGRSTGILLAAGCQGGRAQPQILAQTVPALLDAGTAPASVLARPRWVVGARDLGHEHETVVAEPGARPEVPAGIPVVRTGGPVDEAGHVQIARLAGPRLDAASDPRADGAAVVLGSHEEDRS
ncbi:tyramine oxidase [Amycolatopsis acidicola]|uniref:Tyramine oxidase n=1 Tax=Amycolatopsis acidicola TaxID=2596893 RepID=A0A5N0VHA3_9PSEU|nr:gamma-glutamyltransferase [Amycolatopsis acidicola]KAA9165515.1 tyramine oxidase [Amycolatopsis acidicola]